MQPASHADATAVEMIRKFGADAKRQAIYALVAALTEADREKEQLMREVFHLIMLEQQGTKYRELAHTG